MDDDVIGSEPERSPRRRRSGWAVRVPGVVRRHRRLTAVLAALVAVAAVVTVSRAGVRDLEATTQPGGTKPPLAGEVLSLAAGQNNLYAVVNDCTDGCHPRLLASGNDGFAWTTLTLPGPPVGAAVARSWRLAVGGVEDSLSIEDDTRGTVTSGTATTTFETRRIVDGPSLERVPAGREQLARLCGKPRCATPTLEYLEPRTGVRSAILGQPPFPPRVLGVAGSQLWVAGVDPRTGHYAVAVSMDDGGDWGVVPLPQVRTDGAPVPRIVPIPEQDTGYLLLTYPAADGTRPTYDVWLVPVPGAGAEPHRVRPEGGFSGVEGAVGLKDGRLAVFDSALTVLSPDGVTDRQTLSDVDSTRYVLRQPLRGPHHLLVAEAVRTDGAAAIATSQTGDPRRWDIRPIVL